MSVLPFFRVQCDSPDCGLWLLSDHHEPTNRVSLATEFLTIPKSREAAEKQGWSVRNQIICPTCIERETP